MDAAGAKKVNKSLSDLQREVQERGTRFIVVTGGVCSSIGKGVLISSMFGCLN